MQQTHFKALLLKNANLPAVLEEIPLEMLPKSDVLIAVAYSSLNYKDGLAIAGKGKIIDHYPMVPGIDLAGTVVTSTSSAFSPGDRVILTGWGVGERFWGGYAEYAVAKPEWLVPLPDQLTLKQAMGIGTAGLTAMLCIMTLEEQGLKPKDGQVVVTGAAGGVGSIAIALLASLGYQVVASTGRVEAHHYLERLGATDFLDRSVLASPGKPLKSEQWAGAIDTVGGQTLASLLSRMMYGSSVAVCGLTGDSSLNTTVFPFILRGIRLLGIDSVKCPMKRRRKAWARLAQELPAPLLAEMIQVITLEEIPALSQEILAGRVRGRMVVQIGEDP